MRITLNIDDDLLARARELTDITTKSALIREALRALVERENARRLAKLGGSQSDLQPVPRRRPTRLEERCLGGYEGRFWMSPDFDEPDEDLADLIENSRIFPEED